MSRMLIGLLFISASMLATLSAANDSQPAEDSATLAVGKPAPNFSLPDENGKIWTLRNFKGKKNVVLAFYVKDATPG